MLVLADMLVPQHGKRFLFRQARMNARGEEMK
jgi:hypothetical protein